MTEAKAEWMLCAVVFMFVLFLVVEILLAFGGSSHQSLSPDSITPLPKIVKKLASCLDFCRIVFVVEVLTLESLRIATDNYDVKHLNDCETWLYMQATIYLSIPIICSLFFWIKLFAVNLFAFYDNPIQRLGTVALLFCHALIQIYGFRVMVQETDMNDQHCVFVPFAHHSFVIHVASTGSWLCNFVLFLWCSQILAGYALGVEITMISLNQQARMRFIARRSFVTGCGILCSGFVLLLMKYAAVEADVALTYWRADVLIIYVCFLASNFAKEDLLPHFNRKSKEGKEPRALESSTIELKSHLEQMANVDIVIRWDDNDLFMVNKSYEDLLDEKSSDEVSSSEREVKTIPLEMLYKVPKFRRICNRLPMRIVTPPSQNLQDAAHQELDLIQEFDHTSSDDEQDSDENRIKLIE